MIEFDLTIQELFMVIQVFVIWAVGVRLSPESLRTYGNGVAPGGLCGEIMRSQHRQWVLDSDPSPGFHLWVPFLNFTQMDTSSHTFANVGRADRSPLRACTQYWYSCRIWWPPLWDPAVTVLLVGPRTCTLPLVPPVSPVSKLYASPISNLYTTALVRWAVLVRRLYTNIHHCVPRHMFWSCNICVCNYVHMWHLTWFSTVLSL